MRCSSCGAENEAGRKFCLECGARLVTACPTCGAANSPAAKFCGECGSSIQVAAEPAPVAGSSPRLAGAGTPEAAGTASSAASAPVAERRLVSVLFADLVGFTPFAEEKDPEEVRETLSRYFELARDVVERYGGAVEKFIGDAVMAVWGTPTAHEDDAERAVRAGLELVDAVRVLGSGINARAGILTGEAAVTLGATHEGMVAGDLVNTASRLQSVATPGTVLVGEPTQRAAGGAIAFEAVGDQALKGKAAPVGAWRALRVVAERGGRNRSDLLEAPFVGRDDELRLVKDLFHATSRDGRLRIVSVNGHGGIGKSRLAWEFLKYTDGLVEPVYWHHGRSPSYGNGLAFWALGEMIRGRIGLAEADDDATTRTRVAEALGRWVSDPTEHAWIEPALLTLLGVGGEDRPGHERLFGAWRTFFERVASEGTVVMVFEDLQWADPGLLAFIDHLAEWAKGSPLYVITLARPELLEEHPDWGAGKRNFTSVALEPLAPEAMGELLRGLVPGLPGAALSAIVDRADGVPMYAVETVRMLLSEGRLVAEDGAYRPVGDLSDIAVPETLQSLIAARLDGLEPDDRSLLQTASVLGQSFLTSALAAVAGLERPDLEGRLQALARRELLVRQTDPRSPERGQYGFVQGLVREVAYGTLAKRDRRRLHLASARYFESLDDEEVAGALASQYLAAFHASPAGPESDALAGQARIALRAAAERAASLGSLDKAVELLEHALEVTAEGAERVAILERAGGLAARAARYDAAEVLLEQAIDLHRSSGDRSATARATASLGAALAMRARIEPGLALLEPAAEEFADLGPDPGYVAILGQLARLHFLHQDMARAIEVADRTLPIAERLDLVPIIADVLVTRGTALASSGRAYEGIGALEAGLRLAAANELSATQLRAHVNLSGVLTTVDARASLATAREGLELARRIGDRAVMPHLLGNAAVNAWYAGEDDWALPALDRAIGELEGLDDRTSLVFQRLSFRLDRGEDVASDSAEVEAFLAEQNRLGDPTAQAFLHYYRTKLHLAAERYAAAIDELLEAARIDHYNASGAAGSVIELALLAGDAPRLAVGRDLLHGTGSHQPLSKLSLRAAAAGLAALDGHPAEALESFRDVLATYRAMRLVRPQAFLGLSMIRLLGPREPEARAAAEESLLAFEGLRAAPWVERVRSALAAGEEPRAAAPEQAPKTRAASPG